ncbi:hypothetical protein ARMSODRAFT_557108 [Armillaria solidipes]|uniref:Protein kinase domain-containing protein n=1 Tax=Armillaria solidipes TaxID=1076256 RepID=A0A2H3B1W1_9AGAR|nr:hypothetical protein ARMSODRAFT_557108 [Armillaria solidipes]
MVMFFSRIEIQTAQCLTSNIPMGRSPTPPSQITGIIPKRTDGPLGIYFSGASFHSPKAKTLDTRINFPDRLKTAIGRRQPLSPTSPCLSMRKLTHVWTVHVSTISNVTRATNPAHSPTLLDIFVSHNVEAYRHLQDTNVPRFHGHFLMLIPSQGNRNVNVLLMEYINGGFSHCRPCTEGQGRMRRTQTRHHQHILIHESGRIDGV